jgi:hypothetical protein
MDGDVEYRSARRDRMGRQARRDRRRSIVTLALTSATDELCCAAWERTGGATGETKDVSRAYVIAGGPELLRLPPSRQGFSPPTGTPDGSDRHSSGKRHANAGVYVAMTGSCGSRQPGVCPCEESERPGRGVFDARPVFLRNVATIV